MNFQVRKTASHIESDYQSMVQGIRATNLITKKGTQWVVKTLCNFFQHCTTPQKTKTLEVKIFQSCWVENSFLQRRKICKANLIIKKEHNGWQRHCVTFSSTALLYRGLKLQKCSIFYIDSSFESPFFICYFIGFIVLPGKKEIQN